MEKSNSTVVKSIRLRPELAESLHKMAYQKNRTFANMVETLLLEAVEKLKFKN